jgi:hypothetical protein
VSSATPLVVPGAAFFGAALVFVVALVLAARRISRPFAPPSP